MKHPLHLDLYRQLSDADLDLLASLKSHPARLALARVYEPGHGTHLRLCGPGTHFPDWHRLDVLTLLAIGEWTPGVTTFDRELALLRYEELRRAGNGHRHGVQVTRLGGREAVAERALTEIARRAMARESWESMAA